MEKEMIKNLGPLVPLVGIWEGNKGNDTAPLDNRRMETNKFREHITFELLDQLKTTNRFSTVCGIPELLGG